MWVSVRSYWLEPFARRSRYDAETGGCFASLWHGSDWLDIDRKIRVQTAGEREFFTGAGGIFEFERMREVELHDDEPFLLTHTRLENVDIEDVRTRYIEGDRRPEGLDLPEEEDSRRSEPAFRGVALDEEIFWQIIERGKGAARILKRQLTSLAPSQFSSFCWRFVEFYEALEKGGFYEEWSARLGPDGFACARAALIARGQDEFSRITHGNSWSFPIETYFSARRFSIR